MVDSHVSRQNPTFHLKNRRTFAPFTTGIAPLFGFTAIALGLVGYVTALFKLSAVFTIVWAWLFLGEGNIRQRLLGTAVMLIGGVLIAI